MKSLSILGSTGSIGRNTLEIVSKFPADFQVKTLTAKTNVDRLAQQIQSFRPEMVAVYDQQTSKALKERLPGDLKVEIMHGIEGYRTAACWDGVEITVAAMVGAAGLDSVMAAIAAGKEIALANKETLVMAGAIVTQAVRAKRIRLMPIDSEHSAIFQCLQGQRFEDLDKIILTASGGPFLRTPIAAFKKITPEQAIRHPNWRMGAKISVDSATMMNKGLEVIEAKWLFAVSSDQIDVMIHPQSIVHSMVAYRDGSIIAQMGIPDMQAAIAYALSCPGRLALKQPLPDLIQTGGLTFEAPDVQRFPCLELAFSAIRTGGSMPAVLNAANEIAVEAFLTGKLPFSDIYDVIYDTMARCKNEQHPDLETILEADRWAREIAWRRVAAITSGS
jgi:1-deoxy-D-xylulose-5-phosphate reductoisomerase